MLTCGEGREGGIEGDSFLVGTTVNKWWRHLLGVAQEETDLGEILFDFGHGGFEKLGKTVK